MRRVIGYARVSSAAQAEGSSLRDQQAAIEAYAAGRGMTLARCYVEAESAVHEKIERREQIRALLADVRAGDLVLVDKLDRWSRDPEFTYRSVREILAARASFYAVGDACDPSTPEGDTMLGFRVLFAREEHKRIRQRTVGTRKLLRDRGYYVEGLPPLGYARGPRGPERNVLQIVEDDAELVRDIYRRCVSGQSLQEIADALDLRRDQVHDVLRSRVYLGEVQDSRGEWIAGRHQAILDPVTHQRARDELARRRLGGARPRAGAETSGWMLRDVATCAACGGRMAAGYAPAHRRTYWYRCARRCGAPTVRQPDAEAAASELVLARLEEIAELLAAPVDADVRPVRDVAAVRARLGQRRERHLEAHADGLISIDDLRTRLARVDAELARLDADTRQPAPADRRAVLRDVRTLRRAWERLRGEDRRAIVRQLCTEARLARGEAPVMTWRDTEKLGVSGG